MNVLIVDDDPKYRRFMQEGLSESGYTCLATPDVEGAKALLKDAQQAELILLDVMMPELSGWHFLEWLRTRGDQTPVIFVTARHAVEERVKGLKLGADDYIIKPFEFTELLARIEVVLRRQKEHRKLGIGDLEIDLERHLVERGGRRIEMSPREYSLLLVLAKAKGAIVDRNILLREVWGIDFDPGTNVVNVQIARLRRKIDVPGCEPLIRTVVGKGYTLSEASAT